MDLENRTEELISLSQLSKHLPPSRNGKRRHVSSVYRYALRGSRGIRLETKQLPDGLYTSLDAWDRFVQKLTAARLGFAAPPEAPDSAPPVRRHRSVSAEIERVRASLRRGRAKPLRAEEAPRKDSPLGAAQPNDDGVEAQRPVVLLGGPSDHPIVLNKQKPRLSKAVYPVVKALLDSGASGLHKRDLDNVKGDAVKYLRALRKNDKDWAAAIIMAGKPGKGYRIRHE